MVFLHISTSTFLSLSFSLPLSLSYSGVLKLVKTKPQGLKEDMMKYITENQDNLLGKVIQVKCNGLSNDRDGNFSLLYPTFVAIRYDKDSCDSLESIKEIENMVKLLEK